MIDVRYHSNVRFKQTFESSHSFEQYPAMTVPTKEQILDAAEKLITERGIDAVSLRAITKAADVNLAAVHYHFGSKDALVHKVFERRIRPVNDARMRMLDALEQESQGGRLDLEKVLRALIEPAMRLYAEHERGPQFMRVCGRIYAEQARRRTPSWSCFGRSSSASGRRLLGRCRRCRRRRSPGASTSRPAWSCIR